MAWAVDQEAIEKAVKEWPTFVLQRLKVVAHYGFVPLVILVGVYTTEPKPQWIDLIGL